MVTTILTPAEEPSEGTFKVEVPPAPIDFSPYRRIALRAWAPPVDWRPPKPTSRKPGNRPASPVTHALVFDTETTTDEAQGLLFGAYRYVRIDHISGTPRATTVEEGLIHADDLPDTDPNGLALLRDYVRGHSAQVDFREAAGAQPSWRLYLLSRSEFADRLFHVGYPHNKRLDPAAVVGFNLPFDLSRIATGVTEARRDMRGGFSLIVWTDDDGDPRSWRPYVSIKNLDSKRALMKFRKTERGTSYGTGHLLDLRTLVYALTGEAHSLDSACQAFGVKGKADYPELGRITVQAVDYCREDVAATTRLLQAALAEHARHPIDLHPAFAYSAASLAKSYLTAMGITPRLSLQPDFSPTLLGASMSAYYGGRAQANLRHVPVPVQLVDFTSMYPTVDALMKVWHLVTAETVEAVDATIELQTLLDNVTLEDLYDPGLWPLLVAIAEIVPDGDIVPVRADYSPISYSIGVNRLHALRPDETYWYTLADLIASKLLSGKTPRMVRGVRLVGHGRQRGLRPVKLAGRITIDPAVDDFFTRVVEERQRLKAQTYDHPDVCWCQNCGTAKALKVLANSGSYGIYGEMIRGEIADRVTVHTGREPAFTITAAHPETPGRYCFPPIAAAITGAARVMLAMLEAEVTTRGGSWTFCDTDSMAIVTTPDGGDLYPASGGSHRLPGGTDAVQALSADDVAQIRAKFNRLNPYDRTLVPDVLHVDKEGTCLAISAKRYVIYRQRSDDRVFIVKRSEHGLGRYLVNLDAWIDDAWRWIVRAHRDPEALMPEWGALHAVSRITVSSPTLSRVFEKWNTGKGWAEQIKPFNFITVVDLDPFGLPEGADPDAFRLIAPYGNAHEAGVPLWRNLYNPDDEHTTTIDRDDPDPSRVLVKTLGQVLREYRLHPERKLNGPDGRVCMRTTTGSLGPRQVYPAEVVYIGKEANRLDEVQTGLVSALDDVVQSYQPQRRRSLQDLGLPILAHLPSRTLADMTGVDRRTIERIRKGQEPRPELRRRLIQLAVEVASHGLGLARRSAGVSDESLLVAWLHGRSHVGARYR